MGVAGELTTIGLAEVFQNLAFNRLTGTLTLAHGAEKARIAFEEGRIRAVRVGDRCLDYVAIARQAQAAPDEALDRAASARRRRTLKAFLQASGAFDEGAYDAMVGGFAQEEILPLFGWHAGKFKFDEGPLKERGFEKEQLASTLALDPMAVVMEAARRQDEWAGLAAHAPTESDILAPMEGTTPGTGTDGDVLGGGELGACEKKLLGLLNGTQSLAEAISEGRLKKYDGMKAAARLIEAGLVGRAGPERLRALAERSAAVGDVHRATRQLEAALAMDERDPKARRALVRLHERAGEKNKAAAEHLRLADLLSELGDREGTVESFERAAVLAPRDLDVLERLFSCHVRGGEKAEALRAGRRLAEALLAQDMAEDARPLYERLLREFGGGSGVREAFVQCLLQLEDHKRAATQLLAIAERAYDHGEFDRALKHLRRVIELDPDCAEAQERIDAIDSGRAQRQRKRRRRGRSVAIVLALLAVALWQGAREWTALTALHNAESAIATELTTDNGDTARLACYGRLAAVVTDHGWTRGARRATDLLESMLKKEAQRIQMLAEAAARAKTVTDVEYTDGRAQKLLSGVDRLPLSENLRGEWSRLTQTARKHLAALRRG